MKQFYLLSIGLILYSFSLAQNVGIGTSTPNSSAKLEISSTNSGILIPRVALTNVTNGTTPVSAPATGLMVYNTNAAVTGGTGTGFYFWDGTVWQKINSGTQAYWSLLGNAGTVANTNFIGTTDAIDFVTRTSNTERMRVTAAGNVGIGVSGPTNKVDIAAAARSGTHGTGLPLYVTGTLAPGSAGAVGVEFRHDNGTQGIGFGYNTIYATGSNANQDLGLSSRGVANLNFTTNALQRMIILGTNGYVGIGTITPVQNLDINGRLNVANGVIQRGTTQITATSDLGLYQQVAGNWIRIATNAAPIKFYTDQGGGNSAGTNALVNMDNSNGGGVKIAANSTGGLDATTPNSAAVLDIESTTKGVLFPRMTTAQRNAITSPTQGLTIYNTDTQCTEWWDLNLGGTNKWNSHCRYCNYSVTISANQSALNFANYLGANGILVGPYTYCVTINSGVTIQASTQGGVALDLSTMPSGAKIFLTNNGRIVGGGGNGGIGGAEGNTTTCSSQENNGGNGGNGGHAILSAVGLGLVITNTGLIAGGGGGAGGGDPGCCSAGGGGGGGAGLPAGLGGAGRCSQCAGGTLCLGCTGNTCSGGGNNGNSPVGIANATGGNGGAFANENSPCGTGFNGNNGAIGGSLGGNGGTPADLGCGGCSDCRTPGNGGIAGKAISGGIGNSLTNSGGGLSFGAVD